MRILLVGGNYHPFIGGVEVHLRQLGQELAKTDSVTVAAGNFKNGSVPPKLVLLANTLLVTPFESYRDGDVIVHSLTPTPLERLRLLPIALRAAPRLQRHYFHALYRFGYRAYRQVYLPKLVKLAQDADVVHALAHGYIGWAAQAAARRAGIPCVVTPFVHPHQWGDSPHDVAFYERADAVIGLVETDRDYLVSLGVPRHNTHVIGVSPDLPPKADGAGFRARHELGDAPVVLYVGRMMPQKGANALVQAAPQILAAVPNARILFIGPASESEAAVFADAPKGVTYLGKVSAQEKADALAACDVFCMPSISEILPIVYLEAWSFGKPVVGGMAHGVPELVEGNRAGKCAPQEPGVLAETVLSFLINESLRRTCGENGRRLVEEKYSVPAVTNAHRQLYESLIRKQA